MTFTVSRRALIAGASATFVGVGISAAIDPKFSLAAALSSNKQGPRWALLIDQAACARSSGCRACIDACHEGHSVPQNPDPRHVVKWLWKEPFARAFPAQAYPALSQAQRQLPVLVLCNHCENPPCASVCPSGATWKRADGVVAMDPHRCIGCRYCMAACPYEARSFNWQTPQGVSEKSNYPRRSAGVVEKCTLCADRIDIGQIPLCVEACRRKGSGALSFGDIADSNSEIRRRVASGFVHRRKPELGTEPQVYYML